MKDALLRFTVVSFSGKLIFNGLQGHFYVSIKIAIFKTIRRLDTTWSCAHSITRVSTYEHEHWEPPSWQTKSADLTGRLEERSTITLLPVRWYYELFGIPLSQAGNTFRYRAAMCFLNIFFFLVGLFIGIEKKQELSLFLTWYNCLWIIFLTYKEQGCILSVGVVYVQFVYTIFTFIVVLVLYSAQWALNEKRARVWFKCHLASLKSYFKWTVKGLSSCFLVIAHSLQSLIASVLRPIDITGCRRPHSFTFTLIFSEWSQWNGPMLVQSITLSV